MKVDVYRNLQKECISVRSRKSGLVVDHVDEVRVRDVQFVVQPAGRRRVIEEQRKNVHAFVRGIRDESLSVPESDPIEVTYDPYEYESFVVRETEQPIEEAAVAIVTPSGVRAWLRR